MSCLYALVQYKHTAMSLTNEFYLYFTLDPQILNFFWVQISRASLSASWNQRALTTATCSGFNSVSFPMTFCPIFLSLYLTLTLSRYCSLFFLPPLLHLLLYLLFVCFFIPSIALSMFLFVFQTPPLVKQILLHLVFWFCVPFALTFLIK